MERAKLPSIDSICDPDLVFDVGLHRGCDARYYLDKGFKVVGIEASPALCSHVEANFQTEISDGKLVVCNKALWETSNETVPFFITAEKDDWGSLFRGGAEKGLYSAIEIQVETITLRDLFDLHGVPYYLKCDIEGGDAILVRQLLVDRRRPSYVSIEAMSISDIACLEACGYTRFQIVNQQFHAIWSIPPNPSREGRYVAAHFDGHMSGLFGRDLEPSRWCSAEEVVDRFAAWSRLRNRDERLAPGWLDIHAGR